MQALGLGQHAAWLRYHDLPGRAPAGVYLHGLACAASSDFPALVAQPPLAGRRAVLVDLLGFGFSDRPAGFGYAIEDHAAAVAALLDRLGLTGCAVIGHSMGAPSPSRWPRSARGSSAGWWSRRGTRRRGPDAAADAAVGSR